MSVNEEDSAARSALSATKYRRDKTNDILGAALIMKYVYLFSLF